MSEIPSTSGTRAGEAVRDVTEDEITFFEKHGWVMLRGLIPSHVASELLKSAQALMEARPGDLRAGQVQQIRTPDGTEGMSRIERTRDGSFCYTEWSNGSRNCQVHDVQAEPFYSLKMSRRLGRVAHRLINRKRLTDSEIGVRLLDDQIWCKTSLGPEGGNLTHFHQDNTSADRFGSVSMWIALDEVTPEQGAMRFLTGSHREGCLGSDVPGAAQLLDRYPKLLQLYEWSPPFHYQPGDATVHHQMMIHGAPEYSSTKPRWAYLTNYSAADVLQAYQIVSYSGAYDPERCPIIYP